MTELQNYKHSTPVQIRFSDIDRLNHVNNACYLTYFETARVNYFRQLFNTQIDWNRNGFVIARTETDHLTPIYLNDEVVCFTRVARLGQKSMMLKSALAKRQGETWLVCARGTAILVAMDYTTRLSIPVPQLWRQLIHQFEGPNFKD